MTDNTIFILINLSIILLIVWGTLLYSAGKSGNIASWIKWWQPTTRRVWSLIIDDSFSKADKILVDGMTFIVFGSFMEFYFLLFTLLAHLQVFTANKFMLIAGVIFLGSLRFQEWIIYKIVKTNLRR